MKCAPVHYLNTCITGLLAYDNVGIPEQKLNKNFFLLIIISRTISIDFLDS